VLVTGVALTVTIATLASQTTVALIAVTGVVALAMLVAPKPALAATGVFLLLQTPIVNLAGGRASPVGLALQRVPEVLLVVGVVRIGVLWRQVRALRVPPWPLRFLAVFVGAGVISAFLNHVPLFVTALGAFLALKTWLFMLLALTVPWSERDASLLTGAVIGFGPVLLIFSVLLLAVPVEHLTLFADPAAIQEGYFQRGALRSLQGPFPNPGVCGWLFAVCGCYGLAATIARQTIRGSVGALLSLGGVVGSLRRKPLLGLPIAAVTAVWANGSWRQRWAILGLIILLGGAAMTVGKRQVNAIVEDTKAGYLDPYAPTGARTVLYAVGWSIARDRFPLGAGFGRFGGYVSEIRYSPIYDEYGISNVWGLSPEFPGYIEDTYWPHLLGESGWLGTLAMLLALAALWSALSGVAKAGRGGRQILAFAVCMVLVEALVESVSAPVFETSLQAFVVGIPIGMVLVLGQSQGPTLESSPQQVSAEPTLAPRSTPLEAQ